MLKAIEDGKMLITKLKKIEIFAKKFKKSGKESWKAWIPAFAGMTNHEKDHISYGTPGGAHGESAKLHHLICPFQLVI